MEILRRIVDVLASPARALPIAAERRSVLPPLLLAAAASAVLAAGLVPRLDFERAALDRIERQPDAAEVTPHQREEQLAAARKLGAISTWAGAVAGPAAGAFGVALLLWLAFRVAGASPPFAPTMAVASWALVPKALEALLLLPAALRADRIPPEAVARLAPWSAAWIAPPDMRPALASLASSLNLFTFWSAALVALGMAAVAGTSRARSSAVVAFVCAAVAAGLMALAGLSAPPGAAA